MTHSPKPTTKQPSIRALEKMIFDGVCKATDGCKVEYDGHCPHGYCSWPVYLGY